MKYFGKHSAIAAILSLSVVMLAPGAALAEWAVDQDNAGPRDQVFNDDIIVDGSACVGFDCVNGESFGFDTIKLKENNLRIKFDDTSSSASFPRNDWQITINDSSNGGQEKFSIDDVTGGRTPFTIEASAPSHSLYVDDGGRIGLGTSSPVVELHNQDGDTPTLRLEQDGSAGFTPQSWDVAGNETNFFVRDATNGSTLPFRIRPSAPSSSIDVAGDGDVGIGTANPEARLHVEQGSSQNTLGLHVEGLATFADPNSHSTGEAGGALVTIDGALEVNDRLIVHVMSVSSSREFKTDIEPLGDDVALDALENIQPVTYKLKSDGEATAGFIAEDVPDLVAMEDRASINPMEVVAMLTRVTQIQQKTIEEKSAQMEALSARLDQLESELARTEGL